MKYLTEKQYAQFRTARHGLECKHLYDVVCKILQQSSDSAIKKIAVSDMLSLLWEVSLAGLVLSACNLIRTKGVIKVSDICKL